MQGKLRVIALMVAFVFFAGSSTLWADDCDCENMTYTLDADFDEGTLVNVNHEESNDQLQLDSEAAVTLQRERLDPTSLEPLDEASPPVARG